MGNRLNGEGVVEYLSCCTSSCLIFLFFNESLTLKVLRTEGLIKSIIHGIIIRLYKGASAVLFLPEKEEKTEEIQELHHYRYTRNISQYLIVYTKNTGSHFLP